MKFHLKIHYKNTLKIYNFLHHNFNYHFLSKIPTKFYCINCKLYFTDAWYIIDYHGCININCKKYYFPNTRVENLIPFSSITQ